MNDISDITTSPYTQQRQFGTQLSSNNPRPSEPSQSRLSASRHYDTTTTGRGSQSLGTGGIIAPQQQQQQQRSQSDEMALAYLLRYEQMVRQQEAEEAATVAHLRPLFDRLCVLGGDHPRSSGEGNDLIDVISEGGESSTLDDPLGAAIGSVTVPALPPHSGPGGTDGKMRRRDLLSWEGLRRAYRIVKTRGAPHELAALDQQFMMVLDALAEEQLSDDEGGDLKRALGDLSSQESYGGKKLSSISFPEFLHAYETVVRGMLILRLLPPAHEGDDNKSSPAPEDNDARTRRMRTRDRAVAALRLFRNDADNTGESVNSNKKIAKRESSIRKLLTLKDRQLARLIDSHADEMDDIADMIEKNRTDAAVHNKNVSLVGIVALLITVIISFLSASGRTAHSTAQEHAPIFHPSSQPQITMTLQSSPAILSEPSTVTTTSSIPNAYTQRYTELKLKHRQTLSALSTAERRESSCLAELSVLRMRGEEAVIEVDDARRRIGELTAQWEDAREALRLSRRQHEVCDKERDEVRVAVKDARAAVVEKDRECRQKLRDSAGLAVTTAASTSTKPTPVSSNDNEPIKGERMTLRRNWRKYLAEAVRRHLMAAVVGGVTVLAAPHVAVILGTRIPVMAALFRFVGGLLSKIIPGVLA